MTGQEQRRGGAIDQQGLQQISTKVGRKWCVKEQDKGSPAENTLLGDPQLGRSWPALQTPRQPPGTGPPGTLEKEHEMQRRRH